MKQEKFNPGGELVQVTIFDADEQITELKKDTTGNSRFDTYYHFVDGEISLSTRDTDDNDQVNIWTTYKNQIPVKQKEDKNEDDIMDKVLLFDDQGQIKKIFKEPFAKEKFRTIVIFSKGRITPNTRTGTKISNPT